MILERRVILERETQRYFNFSNMIIVLGHLKMKSLTLSMGWRVYKLFVGEMNSGFSDEENF